jgi:pyruvate dehydrogenase E1 component alpha subunit/2-oxoisovalerate dehydrogenase E1 component alpha subunit
MYRSLLLIRRLDERMLGKQRQGKVGFYGTITGQEATPIGTAFALEERDWVFPALRESSIMLCRGFPLSTWLAQVYGNERDVLKGRQMPSHQSGRRVNQVAWSSCIGPQIPQAVGAAFAARRASPLGDSAVTVAFMGDGATSQPDFHHAMTFAARWKVPCVLVCQNNHWSISVPTEKQTASKTIAIKAKAYGMPGVRVDGNDVLAVYRATREAAERARSGGGPTLIEAMTYRIGPHSTADDATRYRDEAEVDRHRALDPIERYRRFLVGTGVADEAFGAACEAEAESWVAGIRAELVALGAPSAAEVFDHVFSAPPAALERQRREALGDA